jgi:hypothetical protein
MDQVESLRAEVARLQDAKRRALKIADERSKGKSICAPMLGGVGGRLRG